MKLKPRFMFGLLALVVVGAEVYGHASVNHSVLTTLLPPTSSSTCESCCGGPDPASVLLKFYNAAPAQSDVSKKN
jgi:hypothetical protein